MLPELSKLRLQRPSVPSGTPVKFATVEDQQKDHEALFMETMRREHNYEAYMTTMAEDAKRRVEESKAKAVEEAKRIIDNAERAAAEDLEVGVRRAKELFEQTAIDKYGPEYRARFAPHETLVAQIEASDCSICMERLGVNPSVATAPVPAGSEPWVEVCGSGHYFHKWCLGNVMVRGADQCPDCRQPITAAARDFVRAAYPYEGADAVVQAPPPDDDLVNQIDFGEEDDDAIDETEDGLGSFTRAEFAAALTPGQVIRQRDAVEAIMRLGRALAAVTEARTEETIGETRASMNLVVNGLRAWRTWRVVFDPAWVPHPSEEPVPRFADMLGEIAKGLLLNMMRGIGVNRFEDIANNLVCAVFMATLGDLVPRMRPLLLRPPDIDGGLMRHLPDFAEAIERLPRDVSVSARTARQVVERMRAWVAPTITPSSSDTSDDEEDEPEETDAASSSDPSDDEEDEPEETDPAPLRMQMRVQETVRAIVEAGNRIYGRDPADINQMWRDAVKDQLRTLIGLLDQGNTARYFYTEAHWSALRDAIDTAYAMLLVYEQDHRTMHEAAGPAIELLNKLLGLGVEAPTMQAYIHDFPKEWLVVAINRFVETEENLRTVEEFSDYYYDARSLLDQLMRAIPSSPASSTASLPAPPMRRNSSNGYQTRARNRQRM